MSSADELPAADPIELEPTIRADRVHPLTKAASAPYVSQSVPVMALIEGSSASYLGETHTLRRTRLAATALLLALAYAIVFAWSLSSWGHSGNAVWLLLAARIVLASSVAGLLMSRLAFSSRQVRSLEFTLFCGLTALMIVSQYVINLALIQEGDVPGMVGSMKNSVTQMIVLMFLYGTFIPNNPKTVAWVALLMALAPLLGIALLTKHPEVAEALKQSPSVEHQTASNALFLLIGAGMATFGSYMLNGLRTELHAARKFGNYRLLRKLGEGGMGEVYLAEHQLLKRPCALKLIKAEAGADPTALARFEREVQAAARLAHPNTIEIFDYGHTDGTFYYVMEYLKGLSLGDLVSDSGPLPPGRVIYLFRQVCAGLAEAHNLGLVHRDLKPANVFVAVRGGESDVAKVLDFGLVKLTRDPGAAVLSNESKVSGTPTYMAPEQAMGDKALDARADIYALGTMMYYALTGRPPFTADSPIAMMMAHSRDPVVPPSQVAPAIPADIEQVVLRCLAKKPEQRYLSVKALAQALAACASAGDWGPNRADAWWTAAGIAELEESPPLPIEVESLQEENRP
jgi:serine/threonine-protein kinase